MHRINAIMKIKERIKPIVEWLKGLSFQTGLWVLGACVACYIISFAQAALPISLALKGVLWAVFFGLAKTFQYAGILILGKEGIKRLKGVFPKQRV